MGKEMSAAQLAERDKRLKQEEAAKKRIYLPARNYNFPMGGVTHVSCDHYFTDRGKCEEYMNRHNYGPQYFIKELTLGKEERS